MRIWTYSVLVLALGGCNSKTDVPASAFDASLVTEGTPPSTTQATSPSGTGATDDDSPSTSHTVPDITSTETSVSPTAMNGSSAATEEPTPDAGDSASNTSPEPNDAGLSKTISCDPRQLLCKRAAPTCDYGFVPRVVDGCYGDCVAIDTCVCDGPEACPNEERYTCNNSRQRCTPYLN